jgi:hypothetical protein
VSHSLFWKNTSGDVAGAIYVFRAIGGSITNCTFFRNRGPGVHAGTIVIDESPVVSVSECIIADERARYGIYYLDCTAYHACNVFWNNAAGPIYGDALAATDVVANPMFCSPYTGDFTIAISSPAAPANNICAVLIGAYGIGCTGQVLTKETTWGQIKNIYSEQ